MTNSEEDILSRFLQDTFSDYEPEPSDLTWEHIRKEIQPQQPTIWADLRRWIIPVVALLLLVGGIVWDKNYSENKTELAINSTKENLNNDSQVTDYQKNITKKPITNTNEKSGKIYVNTTTSKVESTVISKIEKSSKLPAFSTILTKPIVKSEYSVGTKEYVSIESKQSNLSNEPSIQSENASQNSTQIEALNRSNTKLNSTINVENTDVSIDVNIKNQNIEKQSLKFNKKSNKQNFNSTTKTEEIKEIKLENLSIHAPTNDAVIEEIRYIKPLETLKNKDFVLVKNEIKLPQINEININREAKPVRRPVFLSVNFMPLQTYRILTVSNQNIQNLQTNKLFDSERNGFAFELGITKSIGNKWNLRSSISYLKMRQWAEYQVNTNNISVKNSNNSSNSFLDSNSNNEFIGQTRIEGKTLRMIGLKADVQKFFKITGRNRYFISGGSQLMIEPSEKQTNVFMNASAGFQHLVNKDCFLTIEPTASYLLNNINDSKSLIQTNAYNLGLKVGLNFKMR